LSSARITISAEVTSRICFVEVKDPSFSRPGDVL